MDNITHSLFGAAIGVVLAEKYKDLKIKIIILSILANNIPDSDIFYSSILSKPFGYLLHHRGHTHTIIGALLCGVILASLFYGYQKLKNNITTTKEYYVYLLTALIGNITHLILDYFNTYGVHPFWPYDNKWYYGDILFIIEPTIWISLSFAVYSVVKNKIYKIISIIPGLLGVVLIIFSGKVPEIIGYTIVLGFITISLLIKNINSKIKFYSYIFITSIIILLFYFSGKIINSKITDKNSIVSFIAPSPANPFCWTLFKMEKIDDNIIYTRKSLQLLSDYINFKCEDYSLSKVKPLSIPLEEFKKVNSNCRWLTFLRFSRLPSIIEYNGEKWMTDQRFNRGNEINFSSFSFKGECPEDVPNWGITVNKLN